VTVKIDISVSEKKAVVLVDGSRWFEASDMGTGLKVQTSACLPCDIAFSEAVTLSQSLAFSLLRMLRSNRDESEVTK